MKLLDFLSDLVYSGFKETREGIGEIPNILNCYMIVELLSDIEGGREFLDNNLDLFLEFISIESTYDWNQVVKMGSPCELTRENLFNDHLEMKYYTLKTLQVLFEDNFDMFLRNASLDFILTFDILSKPNKINLKWLNTVPFFDDDVIYFIEDFEKLYYLTEIMDLVIPIP